MSALAWHFARADMRLGYEDGRAIVVGETLTHDGDLKLCESGLHASATIYDALKYAPGPMLCRVRLGGDIIRGDDKLAASERTVLWAFDATDVLRVFARRCALDVIHLWDAPAVVVRYLATGDPEIRAAAWDRSEEHTSELQSR